MSKASPKRNVRQAFAHLEKLAICPQRLPRHSAPFMCQAIGAGLQVWSAECLLPDEWPTIGYIERFTSLKVDVISNGILRAIPGTGMFGFSHIYHLTEPSNTAHCIIPGFDRHLASGVFRFPRPNQDFTYAWVDKDTVALGNLLGHALWPSLDTIEEVIGANITDNATRRGLLGLRSWIAKVEFKGHVPRIFNADDFQAWMKDKPISDGVNISSDALMGLGLAGETGEAIEMLKKHLRDGSPMDLEHFGLELGDIITVIAVMATRYGLTMTQIMANAKRKIARRLACGTISGAGNDR